MDFWLIFTIIINCWTGFCLALIFWIALFGGSIKIKLKNPLRFFKREEL